MFSNEFDVLGYLLCIDIRAGFDARSSQQSSSDGESEFSDV